MLSIGVKKNDQTVLIRLRATGQFAAILECEAAAGLINERRHDAQQCFLNQLNTAPCINDPFFFPRQRVTEAGPSMVLSREVMESNSALLLQSALLHCDQTA